MRRRLFLVGVVVLLVATACGGHSPPRNAVSHTPVPNTRIVPRHITVAYVDAVFVKLNHIYGDAVRAAVKAKAVTPAVRTDLHAIYKNPEYERKVTSFSMNLRIGLNNIRPNPGDQITTVVKLISASPGCIFVKTHTNFRNVDRREQPSVAAEYEKLTRRTIQSVVRQRNPTPWCISLDEVFTKPTVLRSQCGD